MQFVLDERSCPSFILSFSILNETPPSLYSCCVFLVQQEVLSGLSKEERAVQSSPSRIRIPRDKQKRQTSKLSFFFSHEISISLKTRGSLVFMTHLTSYSHSNRVSLS